MATKASDPHLTPATPAPPGQQSQLTNPPNHNTPFIIALVLVIVLSLPCVIIRFYTRHRITRKLWWDDWTCLLGYIFQAALCALLIHSLQFGGATDFWNVRKSSWKIFLTHFHDAQIVARVGMLFTKISFLLFYQRAFITPSSKFTLSARPPIWWAIWTVFWFNVLYAVALIFAVATECINKEAKVARGEQCVNEFAVLIGASVMNIASDVAIFAIPFAAVWGLQMPRGRKVRLSAVFGAGALGVIASVARLVFQLLSIHTRNQSLVFMTAALLNVAEQFIGIIVSCMPILPAFYRHLRKQRSSHAEPSAGGLSEAIRAFQKKAADGSTSSSSGGGSRSKLSATAKGVVDTGTGARSQGGGYEELVEMETQHINTAHDRQKEKGEGEDDDIFTVLERKPGVATQRECFERGGGVNKAPCCPMVVEEMARQRQEELQRERDGLAVKTEGNRKR